MPKFEEIEKPKEGIVVVIRRLEEAGYRIIKQQLGQELINIDGQDVSLPFTNMSGFTAILKNEEGKWKYVDRVLENEIDSVLRSLDKETEE